MSSSLRLSILTVGCLFASMSSSSTAAPPNVTELIVRFSNDQVESQRAEIQSSSKQSIKSLSVYPNNSRPLLHTRKKSQQTITTLARAQANTKNVHQKGPREELNEYVIFQYPNRQALEAAKAAFEKDPNVIWVGENSYFSFQVSPSDPLYSDSQPVVGPARLEDVDYQWGLHSLNMSEVWDYSRGHAYIASLDTGIETAHPDLQLNFRNHFSYDYADNDDDVDEMDPTPRGIVATHAGHGTHVAGILAASSNNTTGVTGVCWNCSLMMGKIGTVTPSDGYIRLSMLSVIVDGFVGMVDTGTQVINMSLGGQSNPEGLEDCTVDPENPFCKALEYAEEMDVVTAAAAGNESYEGVDLPAADQRVIGVGAIDINNVSPVWSSNGPEKDIVAPGVHVLSTFYTGMEYLPAGVLLNTNDEFKPDCTEDISGPAGYGPCSGTSMATPHISGITAILRSVNPLLTKNQIRELLISHASQFDNPDSVMGHGTPNVIASVKAALGTVGGKVLDNRLTPLFSLYSTSGNDNFYTTVPQMAMSAMYESLLPQPEAGTVSWTPYGSKYTPGYTDFPRPANFWFERPKASVYIFTTHRNPLNPSTELVPLYRLSYVGDTTGSNPLNVDHVYTTEQAGIDAFENVGYKLDGIEGYIFPDYEPQPPGTVKLYRKYNPDRDDHAIFPETELADMVAQGYTVNDGNEWIGYVYPNTDSDSDGLIDGFEEIIGTDSSNPDSDYDGINDGTEVNKYPYSDPLDTISSPVFVKNTLNEVTSSWFSQDFSVPFAETPVLLSQLQTFNGGDTASQRIREVTGHGTVLRVEEEASLDAETGHTKEVVGLLGLTAGEIRDVNDNIVGKAGFVTANTSSNNDWKSLTFDRTYTNPVVVMNMITQNGSQPSHIRLKNVTTTGVQYQIEEWDYLDQGHATETMAYIVLEQGEYRLNGGKDIRVGVAETNHNWLTVNFQDIGNTPVVFTQSQTYAGGEAVVTRQRNVTSSGFSVRLQEEEAKGPHAVETIGYIAVQQDN